MSHHREYIAPDAQLAFLTEKSLCTINLDTFDVNIQDTGETAMTVSDDGDKVALFKFDTLQCQILDIKNNKVIHDVHVPLSYSSKAFFVSNDKVVLRTGKDDDDYIIIDLDRMRHSKIRIDAYVRKAFLIDNDHILLVAQNLYIVTISSNTFKKSDIEIFYEENFKQITGRLYSYLKSDKITIYKIDRSMNIYLHRTYSMSGEGISNYVIFKKAIYFVGDEQTGVLYKYKDKKIQKIVDLSIKYIYADILYLDYDKNRNTVIIVTYKSILLIDIRTGKIRQTDFSPSRNIKMIYKYDSVYDEICRESVPAIRYLSRNKRNTILKFLVH